MPASQAKWRSSCASEFPNKGMPAFPLPNEQLDQLVRFLATLPSGRSRDEQ